MKTVLLVEDDGFKCDDIQAALKGVDGSIQIVLAGSVYAAIAVLEGMVYDLVVLDMALPSHPVIAGGGAPLSLLNGGREVLFELQSLGRNDPCVVITQYPDMEICEELYPLAEAAAAMQENYDVTVLAILEYTQNNDLWRTTLIEIFKAICES